MTTGLQDAAVQAITAAINAANAGRQAEAIAMLEGGANGVLQHPAGQNILGALYLQTGREQDALKAFDAAIAIAPMFADAHCNRGVLLQRLGRHADALAAYDMALRHAPMHITALFNRGNVLKLLGRRDDAVAAFDAAIRAEPRLAEAYLNRGRVQLERDQPDAALTDFDTLLTIAPGNIDARIGRASALMRLKRYHDAEGVIAPVVTENPTNVEAALIEIGLLVEMDRHGDALTAVERIIAAAGATAQTLTAKSLVLWKLDRIGEALTAREEAARFDPNDEVGREALAYLYLTLGDFERGFEAYEARFRRVDMSQRVMERATPQWNGEEIDGKRLLVITEQGIGDSIQFIRYLDLLHARGAILTAVVQAPVLGIIRSLKAPVTWTDSITRDTFDFHIPLLSLPRVMGTRLDSVPNAVPYLFADFVKTAEWNRMLAPHGFRVGIAWQGNPQNTNDLRRSVPLMHYAPVAAVPDVRLISLQAVNGLDQLAHPPPGMKVELLGDRVMKNPNGIFEVAAVIGNLDLVVTSDTMTAHLAGALGAPVWVALAHDADWRWLKGRADSPWYPTMRLFRQKTPGDWPGVFAEMASALRVLVAQRAAR